METEIGTISLRELSRSVLQHIQKNNITGIGYDTVNLTSVNKKCSDIFTAAGCAESEEITDLQYNEKENWFSTGELALLRASNNLCMSRSQPFAVQILINAAASVSEQVIRQEMNCLTEICKKKTIQIIGGNTFKNGKGSGYSVNIILYGCMKKNGSKSENKEDFRYKNGAVVLIGSAGEFGMEYLVRRNYRKCKERFSESFLRQCIKEKSEYDISAKSVIDDLPENAWLHDGTFGGVYRLIYEISEKTGMGIRIHHEKIPITQETIEISEFFKINPYEMNACGMYALVFKSAYEAEKCLKSAEKMKITASIAGELTQEKTKIIDSVSGEWERYITPYEKDSVFMVK